MKVEYTGEYPNLCGGKWIIEVNGKTIFMKDNMGTYGEYSSWSFDDDYSECSDVYIDGLQFNNWQNSERGKEVLSQFELTDKEKYELFLAIQNKDFRIGSCGGCI